MARKDEQIEALQAQVAQLQRLLGIPQEQCGVPEGPRKDYIEHGSPQHRDFLGLAVVEDGEDTAGYTTFTSPDTQVTYRLLDELQAAGRYPGMDPEKAALLELRSKVSSLESGPPEVPDDAPEMWVPIDEYATLVR